VSMDEDGVADKTILEGIPCQKEVTHFSDSTHIIPSRTGNIKPPSIGCAPSENGCTGSTLANRLPFVLQLPPGWDVNE